MSYQAQTVLKTASVEIRSHRAVSTGTVWSDEFRVDSPRMVVVQTGVMSLAQGKRLLTGQPVCAVAVDDHAPYRVRRLGAPVVHSLVVIPQGLGLNTGTQTMHLKDWLTLRRLVTAHALSDHTLALEEFCAQLLASSQPDAARLDSFNVSAQRIISEVRGFLSAHLAETVLLADIAQTVKLSPFHLARLFKRETTMSIHQTLLSLRLAQCLDRLDAGDSNLTQVALDAGFSSHAHFTMVFRRWLGYTPSRYREQLRVTQ